MKVRLSVAWSLGRDTARLADARLLPSLEAIDEAGSLSAAARRLELSYRHLWGLLARWEQQCGAPLARLQRGRGARLTTLGRALLEAQRRIHDRIGPELERLGDDTGHRLAEALARGRHSALRITASHDLSLAILRDLLSRGTGRAVALQTRGSLDSLRALAAGDCDLAGFHFPATLCGTRHQPRLHEVLDEDRHRLLKLVSRNQGLMTAPGNPLALGTLGDVADRRARFVNRQSGSGTRLLIDSLLEHAGIAPARIDGYASEEFTHLAVAAMVASGAVDAGFGVEAAARQFGLGFIPVVTEQYRLALDLQAFAAGQLRVLTSILRSAEFRQRIEPLAGYDAAGAGDALPFEQAISAPW